MRHTLLLLTCLLLLSEVTNAQKRRSDRWKTYRHEVGVGYGYSSIYAGLGEKDNLGVRSVLQRSTFNANYRFFILRFLSVKGSLMHGYTRKNDKAELQDDRPNNLRIDYKSSFSEFAGIAEFHLFDETSLARGGKQRRARGGLKSSLRFGISAYAGIAYSVIRPFGEYFGDEVELRPITSNPGVDVDVPSYDRGFLQVPLGVNIRYVVDKQWRVGLDLGYRLGFREYIGNVSGVYYTQEGASADAPSIYENESFVGVVTYGDSNDPIGSLAGDNGRTGYFVGLLSLSYRIKL